MRLRLRDLAAQHGVRFEQVAGRRRSGHEIYRFAGRTISIPRHREINELTARQIIEDARKAAEDQQQ